MQDAATPPTNLSGRRLILARTLWLIVAGLILYLFVAGVPTTFHQALTITGDTRAILATLGRSARFPARFFLAIDIITLLSFGAIAGLLFWRRSTDWLTLFVSSMLLQMGLSYTAPPAEAPVPLWLAASLLGLSETSQIAFFCLFPNGRFVPRWTRWLLVPFCVWRTARWGLDYLPKNHALLTTAENYGAVPQNTVDLVLIVGVYVLGVLLQVYRYRHVATRSERQQMKWLLFGTAVAIAVVGPYLFAVNGLQLFRQAGQSAFLLLAASRSIRQLALLVVPVAITISILRYRLFEIDILINRTLVYGTLTATLGLGYGASVVLFQNLFRALTEQGNNLLAVVASTLALVTLFQPLRRRIQTGIDRRFYRRRYDAARILEAFSAELRDEVDLDQLSSKLVAVVEETMQPAHVSLWLRDGAPRGRDSSLKSADHKR
jgi:hypothetical protein